MKKYIISLFLYMASISACHTYTQAFIVSKNIVRAGLSLSQVTTVDPKDQTVMVELFDTTDTQEPIAYSMARLVGPHHGHIDGLSVITSMRHRKLGRYLVTKMVQILAQLQCKKITGCAIPLEDEGKSNPALSYQLFKLYQEHGFAITHIGTRNEKLYADMELLITDVPVSVHARL